MEITIHCGFPKTGTTALQKWFAASERLLASLGLSYPLQFRDEEGLAHHLLNRLAEQDCDIFADKVSEAASSCQGNKIFLSSEGLSNVLARDDGSGHAYFERLIDCFSDRGFELKLLFTLRRIDKYLKSIIIQNVLYDGLRDVPSVFASHTLLAMARAYGSLSSLSQYKAIKLFEHSFDVNAHIIESIIEAPLSSLVAAPDILLEHATPGDNVVSFFIWLNFKGIKISSDFHSYLRYNQGSLDLMSELGDKLTKLSVDYGLFEHDWEPSVGLIDSALQFFSSSWMQSLSYKARSVPHSGDCCASSLRKHLAGDIQRLIPHCLVRLDYLYNIATSAALDDLFFQALDRLLDNGSISYGQDFRSQISIEP